MKNLKAGIYIKSTDALIGSFFENTTILLVEHNEAGSLGFVINKSLEKSLHELVDFNHSKPFPLMDGGKLIPTGLYLGGNMEQVIEGINTGYANKNNCD